MGVSLYLAVQHGLLWRQDRKDVINQFVWWWAFCTLWLVAGRLAQKSTADPALAMLGLRFQVTVALLSLGFLSWFGCALTATPRRALIPLALCLGAAALTVGTDVVLTADLYVREDAVGSRFWAATPGPGLLLLPLLAAGIIPWGTWSVLHGAGLTRRERRSLGVGLVITLLLVFHDLAMVWRLIVSVQLVELVPVPLGVLASQIVLRRHQDHRNTLAAQVESQTRALRKANATLEAALQSAVLSEQHLRTVQDACSDAMIVVQPGGTVAPLNTAARALLGNAEHPRLETILPGLTLGGDGAQQPVTLGTPGERPTIHDVREALLEDGATLLMVRDITQQRELEARLATAQRLSALGNVVAGVSHAINNPLGFVLSNAETLLEKARAATPATAATAELALQLRDLVDGTHRVAAIVQELQNVSRTPPRVLTPVDLGVVVERAVQRTHARTAPVSVAIPPDTWVIGHEPPLVQVVSNLLLNAADAMEGTPAAVRTLQVSAEQDNGMTVLSVVDSGHGMEAAVAARAMEPFFSTRPVGKGTGLGLWTSYELCRQLGASLSLQSNPGKGTVARVTLPSSQHPLTPLHTPPPAPPMVVPPDGNRLRILVVDDEPAILRAVSRTLNQHAVVCCATASQALEQVRQDAAFELVLCDVMMPEMTGPELKKRLQLQHPQLARRLVFSTGGATDNQAGGALGDTPVLRKPMPAAEMRARIQELAARLKQQG